MISAYEFAIFLVLIGLLGVAYPRGPRDSYLRFGLGTGRRFAESRYAIRYIRSIGLGMVGGGLGLAIGLVLLL